MKKAIIFLLSVSLLFGLCSCQSEEPDLKEKYGENYKRENTVADQSNLYGIGHLGWSGYRWSGIDYEMTTQLIENLGAKSVRNWMHCNWIMNSPTELNQTEYETMKDIVGELTDRGFQVIGLNHSNFNASGANGAKPRRDLEDGSEYMEWLEDYETTWYTMASAFPEILYWEIDNECNSDVFMVPYDGGKFTTEEKAAIYTDMMYFASRGIHRANPDANTVMGGLVASNAAYFLELIYDNIFAEDSWSPYPDDYFQIAAWHPYCTFNEVRFISDNEYIYDVIKTREGKDKKVFFTELGWSEYGTNIDEICTSIEGVYSTVKESLPFVESIHYFRMWDDYANTWGSDAENYFGLFYDPFQPNTKDPTIVKGAPKKSAETYQRIAGGTGSLHLAEYDGE